MQGGATTPYGLSRGFGFSFPGSTNTAYNNIAFGNAQNYAYVTPVWTNYRTNLKTVVPSSVDNLSLPPT
jgi:hypothetical protein